MQAATKMHKYRTDGHAAGVSAYKIDDHSITVLFNEGWYYLYDEKKPGVRHVRKMQELAKQGSGLSTYISRYVRENYHRKWRQKSGQTTQYRPL